MLFTPSKKSLKEIFSSGLSLSTLGELMTLDLAHPFTSEQNKAKAESTQIVEHLFEQGRFMEDLLVEKGLVTHERWEELLHEMAETQTPLLSLLVHHRIVPPETLSEFTEELKREIEERTERGPSIRKILLDEKILEQSQIEKVTEYAKAEKIRFSQAVLLTDTISFDKMTEIFKRHFGIDSVILKDLPIEFQVVHLVPDNLMKSHELLPFKRKGKKLHLAMSDPRNRTALKKIEMMTNLEIIPHYADRREIRARLDEFIIIPNMGPHPIKAIQGNEDSLRELLESDSAVKMVNKIIEGALNTRATDIHVEPTEKGLRIRYRIDGMLYDIMTIPRDMGIPTVSRIKVLAGMDLTERRRPQDGHISHEHNSRRYNLRAASLQTNLGEKMVLRLHDESVVLKGLGNLGLDERSLKLIKELIHFPHGMILVTGPIGSGKTTTLYTAITEINHQSRNIVTLEDPIEFLIPGVNQVQVDPKIGITFAAGLRSILRQDADALLVGEIRDPETASTAVRAANTGHLLFSTLHTNNAISALTALQHLEVARFQIATSLVAIVAQRLVRVLCPECKRQVQPKPLVQKLLSITPETVLWEAPGCVSCFGTGYKGRTGVFEIFHVTDQIQEAIIQGADEKTLTRLAIEEGMIGLTEAGRHKVLSGTTDFNELSRVIVLNEE
jgi:type IV pilus assembly protein PilB